MRRFHFRYQRLLALAEQERHQAALSLAAALKAAEVAATQQQKALADQQAAAQRGRHRLEAGSQGWLLAADAVYRAGLARGVAAADAQVAAAQVQVTGSRDTYREAHRSEEVYHRLRRRAWERFRRQALRREQGLLDEVAQRRNSDIG